jgi:ammonium transporter, Amt family
MSVHQSCSLAFGEEADAVLQCVANAVEATQSKAAEDLNSFLLVVCGALVFFMQAGFAALCAGCVRKKNVQNTMLKNLLDAASAALAFFTVGFAFAFGGPGGGDGTDKNAVSFIGATNFFFSGDVDPAFWFFEYAFSATAVTIVAGTLAERCQMTAYLCYSVFLTGFVYPIAARAIWSSSGFLSSAAATPFGMVGVIDFAGSGVVHVTGGATALIAAILLGARKGRFHDAQGIRLDQPKKFHGHSIALQLLGTLMLWFSCKSCFESLGTNSAFTLLTPAIYQSP